MTKAERILRFIGTHPQGLRLGEISKFIYEMNYPGQSDKRRKVKVWRKDRLVETEKPVHAGYYGTNLLGGGMYGPAGLLDLFCTKTADRRYVLTEEIKAPFYAKERSTKTLRLNKSHREREWKLREAMAPKCPHCGSPKLSDYDFFTTDGRAHHRSWSTGEYKADCMGRIWHGDSKTAGTLSKVTQEQLSSLEKILRETGVSWELGRETIKRFVLENLT